jgi:hypothetical protein
MMARSRSVLTLAAALVGVLLASPAAAQQPAFADVATPVVAPAPAPAAGPTMDAAAVAARPMSQDAVAPTAMRATSRSTAKTQMIVGAVAFVAGALIGDEAGTIIMIGGAALGLWGLYHYLQ